MEASVKMLVYVVNILMMFAGPASCGEVTEVGLAEAAILHRVKTNSIAYMWFALNISCFLVHLISILIQKGKEMFLNSKFFLCRLLHI